MSSPYYSINFPNINQAIAEPGSGVITQPWLLFLINLWNRTGGSQGIQYVSSVGLSAPPIFMVTGSPVTTAGTLTLTLATESANKVWAGPASGPVAQPTFRALVNADMPTSGAGSGTVTSVALALPPIFIVSGSPVTASGTLTGSLATQSANQVWAGPTTGAAATPTFRALVSADIAPVLSSPPAIGNTSPNTGAFTTLNASGLISPTSNVGIKGTTTNDNAPAGSIGEYISASVASGSAVNLASGGTPNDITSISLSAGDWAVTFGATIIQTVGITTLNYCSAWTNSTSATLPSLPDGQFAQLPNAAGNPLANADVFFSGTTKRYSLAGTTTVYLTARSGYSGGQVAAYGFIAARRVR